MPLFALANAGVSLERGGLAAPGAGAVFGGVLAGRVVGKLAGISLATWLAVRLGLAVRPQGTSWAQLAGVATVAGIGFTVPLFVADLAFPDGRLPGPGEARPPAGLGRDRRRRGPGPDQNRRTVPTDGWMKASAVQGQAAVRTGEVPPPAEST